MARVAVRACDFVAVMVVAMPAEASIRCMAIQTEAVLIVYGRYGVGTKDGVGSRAFLTAPYACGVLSRRSMAGFALQLTVAEWPIWVVGVRMRAFEQGENQLFLMTGETAIGTLATVVGILTGSGAGGQDH